MDECRFCREGINPERTKILEENKSAYVTLANPRLVKGHLLIIPWRHIEKISELTEKEVLDVIALTNKYCNKILKISKGYTIRNNYMPFLGETERKVNHLHIQIIPREFTDEIYTKSITPENTLFKKITEEEYEEVMKKIG